VEGVIEAPDKYSAARMIRDQGLSPMSTKEFKSAHTVDEFFNKLFGKIKLQEKNSFYS
jgi:type II secretory pathway component PulF